jgi:uncharacterized phiE125 gp8 family phage protein
MHRPIRTVAPAVDPVTLAEAKLWARIDHSAHDEMVSSMLAGAIAHLDGYTGMLGRCIINQTWKQKFHDWSRDLRLPFPDVSTITSVKYFDATNAEQTVSSSLYELLEDERGSFVRMTGDFTDPAIYDERSDAVSVTFVAGYGAAAENVPDAIKAAIKMLVAHWYDQPAAAEQPMTEIPFGVTAMISPYRRVGI